jgi:hypothetical protein
MIVRVYLTRSHGDRTPGAYVVEEPEARELAAVPGLLEPRVELVEPQPDFDAADIAALATDLFPPAQEA